MRSEWMLHAVAVSMPHVITELLGPKGITTMYGKPHTTLRKLLMPYFSPKVVSTRYLERTLEIAQQTCADTATCKDVKGEDFMKAFTFQVMSSMLFWSCCKMCTSLNVTLIVKHHSLPLTSGY